MPAQNERDNVNFCQPVIIRNQLMVIKIHLHFIASKNANLNESYGRSKI